MRFHPRRLPAVLTLLAAALAVACGGDSGPSEPTPVATAVTITSGPITFSAVGQTSTVTATVRDQNGSVIPGAALNFLSGNTAVASVSDAGVVTAEGAGSTDITVSSGTASDAVGVTVSVVTPLTEGVAVTGLSGGLNSERFFTFEVAPGSDRVLQIGTDAGTGNFLIAVKFGSPPSPADFDCISGVAGNRQFCSIADPAAGTWHVVVAGLQGGYTGANITAELLPLVELQSGVGAAGLGAPQGELLYFDFDVPDSAPGAGAPSVGSTTSRVLIGLDAAAGQRWDDFSDLAERAISRMRRSVPQEFAGPDPQAAPALLTATTSGGTGDVDLFGGNLEIYAASLPAGTDCVSLTDGNAESCQIPSPEAGNWQFALFAFTTFADVTFQVEFTPAVMGPPPGTITIQKAIQSSTGGAADNPASPSLAGFQFQARTAGTTEVIGSGTTTATGTAVITVPQGSYDVVESGSQGLTDFTTAVNGIAVTTDENVDINWVNRQSPPSSGNEDPIAIVNASPGSVPSGDANSTVVTLYAGNSSDPDGDPLGFTWTVPNGTFVLGTNATSTTAKVTFPGSSAYPVTLTVSDGNGGSAQAQTTIALSAALPAPGAFNIELVNIATPSAAVQNALNAAAATWESVIRGNLTSINFGPPNGPVAEDTCTDGQPQFGDIVDDVRIYVDISPIDGPGMVLGSAGPCFTRISDGTTIVGSMNFDSDDLNSLSASTLSAVMLHEMAHVLGIGTLWPLRGFLQNPTCVFDPDVGPDGEVVCQSPGPDTRYLGPAGVAAWRSLGGSDTTSAPVENGDGVSAGEGNLDGHWREIVFQNELMTGFVASSGANPLSQLTIAALLDLGYTVDFAQADNYSVPNLIASPALAEGLGDHLYLGDDIRRGTVWGVDGQGGVVRSFQIGR